MTLLDAAIQVKSLRAQLEVLEAKLRTLPAKPSHTLADLTGILQQDSQSTLEEIEAVVYRSPHPGEP